MSATFPKVLQQLFFENIKQDVGWLLEKNPEIKRKLDIPLDLFTVDEEVGGIAEIDQFIEENKALIRSKYSSLVKPTIQLLSKTDDNVEKTLLFYFLDDFYQYAIYKCVESDSIKETFEIAWQMFEKDFFESENKVELLARLKNVYFHGGMILDDVIPWCDTDVFWARSPLDYRMLGWERKGAYLYEFKDTFQPSWIVLRKRITVSSGNHLMNGTKQAIAEFNLFTFVIRCELKGDAYFNDLRLFGLGHYSPDSACGANWYSVNENDIYEEFGEPTTIENPWDYFISKALAKIRPDSYNDYAFADWQARISASFRLSSDFRHSDTRKLYHLYHQLLNASFVFNSLLPDIQTKNRHDPNKNADLREKYLPILLADTFKMDNNKIVDNIKRCYEIRNKIAHGKHQEARALVANLISLDNFEDEIRFFRHLINRLILLSLVNPNLKNSLETYYLGKDPSQIPPLIKPFQ